MSATTSRFLAILSAATVLCGVYACSHEGPAERAGKEVDKALDTAEHGGHESIPNKIDDAAQDVRKGGDKAADDLKGK